MSHLTWVFACAWPVADSINLARGHARVANTAGLVQTVSDQVGAALADLWEDGRSVGLTTADIAAVAAQHVEYDGDGDPCPRPPAVNVFPFRR